MSGPASPAADDADWFSPSLNRAVIARLPGLPPSMPGTPAGEWLSSMAIARRMAALGLGECLERVPDGMGEAAVLAAPPYALRLDALVAEGRADAIRLADAVGTALAALVATLVLAPPDARAARPEWPDSHWARWASVRRLVVGGGLVAGALGERLAGVASARLPQLGAPGVVLERAADPGTLALRGVASGLPDGLAVLVDGGHTSVKAAVAEVIAGRARQLRLAAPAASSTLLGLEGVRLADRLAEIAVSAAGQAPVAAFGLAIAVYTHPSGQPRAGQASAYGSLARIDLLAHLRDRVGSSLGRPVAVRVSGDGAAAAAAVRGEADAAIVLGTAIGSGLNT